MFKKYKCYADYGTVDGKALAQMDSAMAQPWAIKGALMPDTHAGYSLPIGAVVVTDNMVVPAWVGYDIGCGMAAVKTNLVRGDIAGLESEIHAEILKCVPVGNNRHSVSIKANIGLPLSKLGEAVMAKRANGQLGTLGGGNHFIELGIGKGEDVWIIIHSGSRGLGHGLASEYMKWASGSDKAKEGHYGFPADSEMGKQYFTDALYAQAWALQNRETMLKGVIQAIRNATGKHAASLEYINRNHNHVEEYSEGMYIHRKGATHAEAGMMGVIPGNMRDGCFIVEGLGNEDWLNSSSHGAGRILSRSQAKKKLDLDEFLNDMCNIASSASEKTLDEAPGAYKNIFEVMHLQEESVNVIDYVKPIINVKG